MVELKGGAHTEDARLDRVVQFDERSRGYAVQELVQDELISRTWRIITDFVLDQGYEGACVGFAVTHKLLARPFEERFGRVDPTSTFARETIYWRAQQLDPWEGGAYPGAHPFYEGTSVLAGIQAAQELGYFPVYRWSFSLEELVRGLVHVGPALLGLDWYEDCYTPDDDGVIRPTGRWVGGHAILARAVRLRWKDKNTGRFSGLDLARSQVVLRNSWGPDWGPLWGDCLVSLEDLGWWLSQNGEAVFATER